jgi:hypothetical protein
MAELAVQRQESVARPLERRLAAHRSVAWVHGLIGGLVSGAVMGLFLMIVMWITRNAVFPGGFFRPLELIGSLWYGTITNGASAALLGAGTLLGSSMILGLVWAYAFSYIKIEPLVSGVAFGAILWAIMQYAVLPGAGSFVLGRAAISPQALHDGLINPVGFATWTVLAAYLLFGASLGLFEDVADRRRVRRESRIA